MTKHTARKSLSTVVLGAAVFVGFTATSGAQTPEQVQTERGIHAHYASGEDSWGLWQINAGSTA